MAIEAELADGRILEFPDGTDPSVVQATVKKVLASRQPAPETTAFGQVKEGFKGIVPGAVGLLESAATGASALLPEDMEKAAREKIKSVATAAKEPFAPSAGYEETVGRKLGEAVGSTVPFLAAGPLGLAGRAAAVGLGVGAGAGESRTRAEEAGATGEQRSTATALGIIPGALEAFAPLRILSRIPTASKAAGIEAVKRALVAGGEEAAQEAASGFAQNLIAKGVYKPEQALIEGLGEQAAYGGATGALVQGLMDLALGRRARGAKTTPEAPPTEPGPQVAPEAPLQLGMAPPFVPRALPDGSVAATPEELAAYEEQKFKAQYAPQPKREPEQLTLPGMEGLAPSGQTDLFGEPLAPAPDEAAPTTGDLLGGVPLTTEVLRDVGMAPSGPELRSAGQQSLRLRRTPEGQPTTSITPLTMQDVLDTGIAPATTKGWFAQNVVGKTQAEVQAMVKKDPTLLEGPGKRAKILKELLAPQPVPFKETPSVKPTPTETPAVEQRVEPGAGEPSMGVPSEPAPAELAEPGAGVPPATAAPVTPDGLGLVSAGQPAVPGAAPQGAEPTAVTPPTESARGLQTQIRALSDQQLELLDSAGRRPRAGTTKEKQWDALQAKINALREQFDVAARAERTTKPAPVVTPPAVAPQSPDVDSIKSFPVGPARITPTVIARDKPTYHETNADGLEDLARNDKQFEYSGAFVSDNPDLALGQGANTGVFIEFRPNSISGKVHTKLGTSPDTGQEYKSDVVAPKAISVVTVKDPASFKPGRMTARLLKAEFDKATLPDGSVQYTRKGVTASKALPITQAPEAAPAAPAPAPAKPAVETETAEEEAARKAEAEDLKRRIEELEKAKPPAPKAAPAPAPKAEKSAPKEIPEKLREPVGTSEIGMEEGQKEILRGPQGMLFPMSKREEIEYAERAKPEAEEVAPSKPVKDKRQAELDFAIGKRPEEAATPTKTPTPSDEATLKAISGKPMLDVAQWASNNLPDPDQKVIAQRILVKLRRLQEMGVTLDPIEVTDAGRRLVGAKGSTVLKGKRAAGNPVTITITLNHPSNGTSSGTNPETILHELLHAATLGVIETGLYKSAEGTKVGTAVRELLTLKDAVIKHFNDRVSSGAKLTDFEKRVYQRMNNALRDEHEILVWSMTNREMQQYMETIPYKGQTAWNKFVTYVRDLLGIPAKADTALSEALRVGDTLLGLTKEEMEGAQKQTGKQFQVSFSTESLINSMGPIDPPEKPLLRKIVDGFNDQTELGYAVKFRTQVADSAATIEHRLREQFDGAVKDKLGKFNPMGLYRQAQDYSKMLLEYFQIGAISKEPATGLWKVKADAKVRPPTEVYALIDKWAEKNGYSRERGTQIASRILEGVRLDAMRTSNKNDGTSFLLHLKDNEIDQLVQEYKADPDLQAMSKAMDSARLAMIDNMVAVGRLSDEQGKAWKDVAGYVPFDRIEDFASGFNKIKKISNKGLAQVGKLPELVGSINRPVGNVFDNYLNTLGWMVGQTMKTDGTVQTLRSLEDAGHAKFLGRSPQGKDNTVGMYVKGEMMYWELPSKYDVLAFKDLNPPKAKWLQVLGQASNVLRKAVTVLPPFALKQVTDDVQRAIMTSGVKNPGALLRMSLSNFGGLALAELRGIQHPAVKEFGALGLTGEYDFVQGKPAASVLKDLEYKPRGKFETLIHRLDGITRASDLAVRKAIYDQTMKESGGDQLLAQTRAREFINFRRRGASDFVGAMVTTIPFFNAYIQGMDVLYRAASGKDSSSSVGRAQARRMFWSRAAIAMTLSTLYAMGADDDEDYQEMDLRTRDSNWILPGVGKLPVPGELGALFKVIPERIVEYMRRQGTPEEQEAWEATRTALRYIMEQYVGRVVPVPQGVKPLLEAWTNYSFFTGRELEGIYQKQQDPSLRRASNTSELAIAISEFSRDVVGVDKISPIMIDNALSGYFGSTAGLLVAATDSLLNPTRVDRPLHKWALVSNYMYDPVGTRRRTEFYEEREKVGRANTTLNELMKTDLDKAAAYAESHSDELMLESAVNSTLNQLESTRAYRKFLNSAEGAKEMSKQEREDQLKEIREMEIELTGWLREAKTSMRQ